MKIKKQIIKLLNDPKHWIGWLLSTAVVGGLVFLFIAYFSTFFIITLFLTIMGVDIFKHLVKLQ